MGTQPAVIDALAWLDAHSNLEIAGRRATPTLERIPAMVELLGSPQRAYPILHITGTNGKTSVTRMVARLLQFHGLSVGTYTSPHLERVNERLAWEVGVAPAHLEVAANVAEAMARALAVTPSDGQVVMTGSLYLVGEARSALVTHSLDLPQPSRRGRAWPTSSSINR